MEYKYKTYTKVYEKDVCKHIEDDEEKIEDLMITYWTPLNFEGESFNYLLRNNHVATIPMHNTFFQTVEREWIATLGFSDQYFFEEISKETKDDETIITNNLVKLDLGKKQEIDRDTLIKKHDEEETEVTDI